MRREDIALARSVALNPDSSRGAAPSCTVRPMRLGVDMDLFNPEKAYRAGIEKHYGIAPGRFLALFVGRVDAGKNIPVLMQACARAIARGVNLHLIVAGLGPFSDEVKRTLGDNVTLAGWVEPPELAHLYASVDCLTVVSDIEIGGMIGLEALASGCPVLVSRQSDMAQICGNPVAMHMVESGVEPWVEALCAYVGDVDRQKIMRAAALDFRRDNLASWGDVVEQDFIPTWHAAIAANK
jgi:glycosyltransferase involved in cell wall biosynthesis